MYGDREGVNPLQKFLGARLFSVAQIAYSQFGGQIRVAQNQRAGAAEAFGREFKVLLPVVDLPQE